jgi:hypothetical protein
MFHIPSRRAKAFVYYTNLRYQTARADLANAPVPATSPRVLAWAQANQSAYDWIIANCDSNEFAGSLHASLHKWGSLTERQLTAVHGAIARAQIAKTKAENAPSVSLEPVEVAFRKAQDAGIARPKLRLGEFTFSPAPANGKNPNAIYVKGADGTYLGKVAGGRLFTVASVSPAVEQDIVAVASDPLNSAIAYGKRYGKCSVCARTLTDEDSINRGIGPVCAERFGW